MKLNIFYSILLFVLISLTFSNPINTEIEDDYYINDNRTININNDIALKKRYDVGTYISSIVNFFTTKDVARNIFYKPLRNLDVFYEKKSKTKKPVVIFIYGGTWSLGEKSMYSKFGDFLRDNGFVGVIPNYIQFPFGTLDNMVKDISESIQWVYNNIHKYGGDNNNMIIIGHSSGAHLAALTLFRASLKIKSQGSLFIKPLPKFQRAVLLNGPYDFDLFSNEYKKTGKFKENSKFENFVKMILHSDIACPTDILKNFPDKSVKSLGVNRFNLLHSDEDVVVPIESPNGLIDQIRRVSNIPAKIYHAGGFYHCGITEGVMNGDSKARKIVKDLLTRDN